MSYHLLLGIGDGRLANSFRAQLSELPDMHISSAETSSGDVVGALSDESPIDVLLLHEDLGPLPTFQLIRDISLRHPHLAVVLVAEEPTPETFSAAMEAGVRAVVSARPSLDELQTRISTAAEWARSMRRHLDSSLGGAPVPGRGGALIAITGAKGGTGATTLAIHQALVASGAQRTVCLVDMDLQAGDIPSYLDLTHRRSIVDLVEVADDVNPTVLADTLYVHPSGPHVLLAPSEGERGEDVTARVARQVLGSLRSRYEVVIVDCGAHMTEASAMAVEMADRVLVTTTPDMPSLRAARRLVKLWARLQVRKEDDLGVVLVRASRHSEIQPDFARRILQLPLLRSVVPASFRALEGAANTGAPTSVEDDGFRRAMGQLAIEIGAIDMESPVGYPPSTESSRRRKRKTKEDGQTTIEFAGLVPLLLFVLIFLWQIVILGVGFISAGHAANEGAHAAAIGKSPEKVADIAKQAIPWGWDEESEVHYEEEDDYVAVEVAIPFALPGIFDSPWSVGSKSRVVHEE